MNRPIITEANIGRSGITYTSIREGFYAEAFSIFLDWESYCAHHDLS